MSATTRNVLVVVALAAAVYAIPGGDSSADLIASVLGLLITASFAFLGWRLYRERRMDIVGLGDRYRGMLYVALGAIILMLAGASAMFDSAPGALLWCAVLGAAIYTLVLVFRHYRADPY